MKYFEFGQGNPELMVMLPGGGVCYRGAIPIAEEMAKVYHVVLVAYDGFNPDEPGAEYKSTQDEAKRLGDYVVEHCGGRIDILYGVSYGTFVLMDVLADRRLTITTTIMWILQRWNCFTQGWCGRPPVRMAVSVTTPSAAIRTHT